MRIDALRRLACCCLRTKSENRQSLGVAKSLDFLEKTGAGDEIRTHDPNLGKVVLYP